jgi:hypothetical protein
MSMFSRCALLAVLAALALAWPTAAVSQPSPGITVLDPDKLEITGDSVKTLTIRNDTSATVGLQFSAEPGEEDGSGGTTGGATTPGGAKVTVLPSTSTALQAHAVGQFDLEISADKPFDGYLSVGVNGAYQSDQGNGTQIPLSIRTAPWWKQPTLGSRPAVRGSADLEAQRADGRRRMGPQQELRFRCWAVRRSDHGSG